MKYLLLLLAVFLLSACTTSEDASSAIVQQNYSDIHISNVAVSSETVAYGDEWSFDVTVFNPTDEAEYVSTFIWIDDIYITSPPKNLSAGSSDKVTIGPFINDYSRQIGDPTSKTVTIEVFLPSFDSRVIRYVYLLGGDAS